MLVGKAVRSGVVSEGSDWTVVRSGGRASPSATRIIE